MNIPTDLQPFGLAAVFAFVVCGCGSLSATQKLSDNAQNVATAERFGRMDLVTDSVSAKHRDEFAAAHSAWGHSIRIVDLEYAGMRVMPGDIAHVELIVAWQRVDESTLRTTTLLQTWSHADRWEIEDEKRISGDTGLIDEPDEHMDQPAKPENKKFRQLSRTETHSEPHTESMDSDPQIP